MLTLICIVSTFFFIIYLESSLDCVSKIIYFQKNNGWYIHCILWSFSLTVSVFFDSSKKGHLWQIWWGGSQRWNPSWVHPDRGLVICLRLPWEPRENVQTVFWKWQPFCRWEKETNHHVNVLHADFINIFLFLDFYTNELPLQFGGLQPGVIKNQDPHIERDLHLSLDDLFHGCSKKIKISRRVRAYAH